ncbi:hypothetical protein D3C81_1726250 [compost metagenome]
MAGIEYHGLELWPQASHPGGSLQAYAIEAVAFVGQAWSDGFDLTCQRPSADDQCALHRAQAAGLPAFQRCRAWQPEGVDEAAAEVGVGKAEIAVAHVRVSLKASIEVWTNFVGRSFECGKNT